MVLHIFVVIFSIVLQNQLTYGLSKDDKIVVTDLDSSIKAIYVAPMSRDPELSSTAITLDNPSLIMDGGPGRVRWDGVEQKLYFTIPNAKTVVRSNLDGTDSKVVATGNNDKIVVTDLDSSIKAIYVAPMSRDPELSSTAITLDNPSLIMDGGPGRVRWDGVEQKLYFTIPNAKTVVRSNLDGTDSKVVATGNSNSLGLAVDEEAKKIYWSTTDSDIFCTDYDGSTTLFIKVLNDDDNDAQNLALDKKRGFLYFTDDDDVWRVGLDGAGLTKIVVSIYDVDDDPVGLVLDEAGNKLVWSDTESSFEAIQVVDAPDGKNRTVLYATFYPADVSDMTIYYDNLYMVSSEEGQLLRMPKDGSLPPVFIGPIVNTQLLEEPYGITVVFSPPCVTDTLELRATSTSELSLTWAPQSSPPTQCDADQYQVIYQPYDPGSCSITADEPGTLPWQSSSTAIVSNLAKNTYYQITISSRNWPADGQKAALGNFVNAVEPCLVNLLLEKLPTNLLQLRWGATMCECKASEYRVEYTAIDYCNAVISGTMPWQTQTNVILPLQGPYRRVEVYVTPRKIIRQINVMGRPLSTSLDRISSISNGAPGDVTPSDVATDSVKFSWEDLACNDLGGETLRYSYELTSRFGIIADQTSLKTVTFMNLRCGTEYTFRVAAVTVDGSGPLGDGVTVETLISKEPFASELSLTSTPTQAISWTPSECPPLSFDVEYTLILRDQCEVPSVLTTTSLGSVPGSPANLNNLLPFSTYIVSIIGIGSSGVRIKKSIEFIKKESVPSAQPLKVEKMEATSTSLMFTWQSLPCTTRNGDVTYQYQLLQQSNVVINQRTSDNFAVLSSLGINTEYEFRVAALTSAGMGSFSSPVQATTLEQCTNDHCLNAGLCLFDEASETLSCRCVGDYFGTRCEIYVPTQLTQRPAALPNTQTEDMPGPGIISAISLSTAAVVISTIAAIGVFYYIVVRARRASTGTQPDDTSQFSMRYMYPQAGELDNYGMY